MATSRTPSAGDPPRSKCACNSAAIGVSGGALASKRPGKLGGTSLEQTALAVPNSGRHLGTVPGMFRHCEAGSPEPETPENCAFSSSFIGAGEGIRTLDPNLGKVVLYP
jgi:hypothetical protein